MLGAVFPCENGINYIFLERYDGNSHKSQAGYCGGVEIVWEIQVLE